MTDSNVTPALRLGRYRHYKGREYQVLALAQHSESRDWLVVYRCLYDDFSLWVRPLSMFQETVQHAGETRPRFAWLEAMDAAEFAPL